MKKHSKLFALIAIALLGLFIANKVRMRQNKIAFDATKDYEEKELTYCQKTFAIGITISEFNELLKKEAPTAETIYTDKKDTTQTIILSNLFRDSGVVKSGRSYCGINLLFKNDRLYSIEPGYPCH